MVSIIGNTLAIHTLLRKRMRRKRSSLLFLNLALADCLVTIFPMAGNSLKNNIRGVYSSCDLMHGYMCHNWYNLIDLVWINWYIDIGMKIIKILIFSKALKGIQYLFFVFDKRLNFANIRLTILGPSRQTAP